MGRFIRVDNGVLLNTDQILHMCEQNDKTTFIKMVDGSEWSSYQPLHETSGATGFRITGQLAPPKF